MADLDARLAAAVTDAEAREAIREAIYGVTFDPRPLVRADNILAGDPAGWIGIGVLMVPEGWPYWRAGSGSLWAGWAHINRYDASHCDRKDEISTQAKRPDCALVLAALAARRAGGAER